MQEFRSRKRRCPLKDENSSVGTNYLTSIASLFKYYKTLGEKAISQVKDEEIGWQPRPRANSIAVVVKHLSGNMLSRWTDFLESDGEKPWRDRDAEFVDDIEDRKSLLSIWEKGWSCLFSSLAYLKPDDLARIVYIRNEGHTVLEAMNRQVTHYAYHVGQIVYLAKSLRSESWKTLSVPLGGSEAYNKEKFNKPRRRKHFT